MRLARVALVGFALVFAAAQSDAQMDAGARLDPATGNGSGPSFAIVSQSPAAEIRFRGITLKSARTDPQQNQIALDFNQPVDSALFDQLQQALPDWVDSAFGGYDNAVIHARRPVQFLTRNESDGFSIRIVEGQQVADAGAVPPSAPPRQGPCCIPGPDGVQDGDAFALRGSDVMRRVVVRVSGDWHHANRANVYAIGAGARIPVGGGFKIVGSVRAALANGNTVRHLDGSIAALRKSVISGGLGAGYDLDDGSEMRLEALYAPSGLGGMFSVDEQGDGTSLGFTGAWHAPYLNTAEEIADNGSRDFGRVFGTMRFFSGFWGRAEARYERFNVKGDSNVATTAGFTGGLRYVPDWFGIPVGLAYDVEGDYIINSHRHLDPALTPFIPMDIKTREVHAVSAFAHIPIGDTFAFDAFGGYAYDRYGPNGPFGGADLVIEPAEGWKLMIGGLYSQVPNRQGETGTTISGNVKLVYDLSSGGFDPFTPSFLPDAI